MSRAGALVDPAWAEQQESVTAVWGVATEVAPRL
jgi:hypothetical protein